MLTIASTLQLGTNKYGTRCAYKTPGDHIRPTTMQYYYQCNTCNNLSTLVMKLVYISGYTAIR